MKLAGAPILGMLVMLAGCGKPAAVDSANWSKPEVVAKSRDSLDTGFSIYKWNASLLAIGGEDGTFAMRFLQEDGTSWRAIPMDDPGWIPLDCDTRSSRIVITRGLVHSDKIEMSFATGALNQDGSFRSLASKSLVLDRNALFGKAPANLTISQAGTAFPLPLAWGTINGADICVPYSIRGYLMHGNGFIAREGPFDNGVFCSMDSGQTWRLEHISDFFSLRPFVCKTEAHYYYFAGNSDRKELWYARKTAGQGSWSAPVVINKTFGRPGGELSYRAVGEGDTVHLCWLDRRHEKKRLNLTYPNRENYEVVYNHRRDSDASWSKDIILSEGLLYSYAPSMSVEGNKIVVAWAGVRHDKDGHNEFASNDIYYVTSKDAGKSWGPPQRVTDNFNAGITAGLPQVALHNGVIHLFYVQGRISYKKTGGMVKLNQPPWPIYYQRRAFPK